MNPYIINSLRSTTIIFLLSFLFGISCKKDTPVTTANGSDSSNVNSNTAPVDSIKIKREYYTSNRTDLFIFYNGKEHKAESAVFDLRKNPSFPIEDHFTVFFPAAQHDHYAYCLELNDSKTSQNIGEAHLVSYLVAACSHMGGHLGVANGYRLVVTKLTQDSISGYFWYESSGNGSCGAFNNVPIIR